MNQTRVNLKLLLVAGMLPMAASFLTDVQAQSVPFGSTRIQQLPGSRLQSVLVGQLRPLRASISPAGAMQDPAIQDPAGTPVPGNEQEAELLRDELAKLREQAAAMADDNGQGLSVADGNLDQEKDANKAAETEQAERDESSSPEQDLVRKKSDLPVARPISEMRISIREGEKVRKPEDRSTVLFNRDSNDWFSFQPVPLVAHWDAANISCRRLYFEDPLLERYGRCSNPTKDVLRSTAHFSTSLIMWPLRGIADAPGVCDTPLGFCRPGSITPCYREQLISR